MVKIKSKSEIAILGEAKAWDISLLGNSPDFDCGKIRHFALWFYFDLSKIVAAHLWHPPARSCPFSRSEIKICYCIRNVHISRSYTPRYRHTPIQPQYPSAIFLHRPHPNTVSYISSDSPHSTSGKSLIQSRKNNMHSERYCRRRWGRNGIMIRLGFNSPLMHISKWWSVLL